MTDSWGHRWTLDGSLWRETLPGQGGAGGVYPPEVFVQYAIHNSRLAPHVEAIANLTDTEYRALQAARQSSSPRNRCEVCGVDMGDCNPRQLCGKTYCREDEE